ncbi:unnamed protein product, partial [Brenthis ino]
MHRTPPKTSKPPAVKAKTAKPQATSSKTVKTTATTSPSPSKISMPSPLALPLPPNITKLIREKSEILPPKEVLDDRAEEHYRIILENINDSKNIKTTIRENIALHAKKLYYMVNSINCEMTELAREILAAVMERLDQAPKQQTQEMTEFNKKIEKQMEQVIIQNLDLKNEIMDLKAEIKEIKEEKSKTELMEELQKQNIATEKTQKDIQEMKEDIKAIPISQPTPTEKPNTTPQSYSQALQQPSLPKPTLCLLVDLISRYNENTTEQDYLTPQQESEKQIVTHH